MAPPTLGNPGGFSLTAWLDPAMKYFAEQANIPLDQYSSQVGGESIGTGLEVMADLFTKGWLNKTIQAGAGLFASGYAVWGKDVSPRLRRELLALGTHELLRVTELIPQYAAEFQTSLVQSMEAGKRGDWNAVLASVLKTPGEVQTAPSVPSAPVAPTTQARYAQTQPGYAPTQARYGVSTQQTAPPRAVSRGRYQVIG